MSSFFGLLFASARVGWLVFLFFPHATVALN